MCARMHASLWGRQTFSSEPNVAVSFRASWFEGHSRLFWEMKVDVRPQRSCAYQLISLEFSGQSFLPFKCAHLLRKTPAETVTTDKNIFQIDLYNGNKLFCVWLSLSELRGSQTTSCFLGTGFPMTKHKQISSQSQGKHSNTISTRLLGSFFYSISSLRNSCLFFLSPFLPLSVYVLTS